MHKWRAARCETIVKCFLHRAHAINVVRNRQNKSLKRHSSNFNLIRYDWLVEIQSIYSFRSMHMCVVRWCAFAFYFAAEHRVYSTLTIKNESHLASQQLRLKWMRCALIESPVFFAEHKIIGQWFYNDTLPNGFDAAYRILHWFAYLLQICSRFCLIFGTKSSTDIGVIDWTWASINYFIFTT